MRANRKDYIFMQRRLKIDKAHMALGIYQFVVFVFFWSPLWFYVPRRSIFLLAGLCFYQRDIDLQKTFKKFLKINWWLIGCAVFYLTDKSLGCQYFPRARKGEQLGMRIAGLPVTYLCTYLCPINDFFYSVSDLTKYGNYLLYLYHRNFHSPATYLGKV